jgi:alpha-ketoglutarate-dependent taurine dioxygenase
MLKISLGFQDDDCRYLEQLVLNLHKYHRHGLPITHSASRGWFWDVRPTPSSLQVQNRARSETMEIFPWHTDCSYEHSPPRFFALQVLQPDQYGGGTLSVLNVDRALGLLSPSARAALVRPEYRFAVPPEFVKSDERHIVGSVLGTDASGRSTRLRFRGDIITPLTTDAGAALQELKTMLRMPLQANTEPLHLTPAFLPRGSIILMDNRRWLHSRNQVRDPNRHLRRIRWDTRPFLAGSP